MTSERSLAYGRVMKTLEDLGPAKLHDLERQRVRQAADALLFAPPQDPGAFDAITDIEHLAEFLTDSGRWTAETAAPPRRRRRRVRARLRRGHARAGPRRLAPLTSAGRARPS